VSEIPAPATPTDAVEELFGYGQKQELFSNSFIIYCLLMPRYKKKIFCHVQILT